MTLTRKTASTLLAGVLASAALSAGVAPAMAETTPTPVPGNGIHVREPIRIFDGGRLVGPAGSFSADQMVPMATWGACGVSDGQWKLVRTFSRAGSPGKTPAGKSLMHCGTSSWGYRHIQAGHSQDFLNVAALVGSTDWRSMADFMMVQALGWPATITKQANGSWLYRTQIQIRDRNDVIRGIKYSNVAVNPRDFGVITAFPTSS